MATSLPWHPFLPLNSQILHHSNKSRRQVRVQAFRRSDFDSFARRVASGEVWRDAWRSASNGFEQLVYETKKTAESIDRTYSVSRRLSAVAQSAAYRAREIDRDLEITQRGGLLLSISAGIGQGTFAAVGVDPAVMGVGPAVAIPAAVKSAGLELDNIDLFEINEAFGSQFVYCQKKLELDPAKINVNGGAMAMGHPLGATGARCVATLLHEMKRRGRDYRFGVVSMCIGTGMRAAAVFERGETCDETCNARKIKSNNFLSKDTR